ncbi:MAG: hypothetical protein ACP5VR_04040 [Acidimicrobiales bacterium]
MAPGPKAPSTPTRTGLARLFMSAAAIAVVATVVQVAGPQLKRLAVEPLPQQYIALDFPSPDSLPVTARAGAVLHFIFDIVDNKATAVDQQWKVMTVLANGKKTVIARGRELVSSGHAAAVRVAARAPRTGAFVVQVDAPGSGVAPLLFHVAEPAT